MHTDPNILIANSSAQARALLKQTLKNAGFESLRIVDSGLAAIDILKTKTIDILITDTSLTDLDGWRLTRLVRSGALETDPNMPILIVSTTYSERIAEVTAKEFEVSQFITFEEIEILPTAVSEILGGEHPTSKSSLLVIEDLPDTVKLVSRILSNRYDIETATDGESGLDAWKERRHDLVLLDIMLPKRSGEEVLKEILSIRPNQAVVMMTAHSSAELASRLLLNGAVDFIAKPFRAEQLRRVCEIAIHREDFIISNEQFYHQLEQLRGNEEKYRCLVEALTEEYFFYSRGTDGSYTYLSPSITNVLGYTQSDFSRNHATYLSANPINKEALALQALSNKGVPQPTYEIELLHKDGTAHTLEATETPLFDKQGNLLGVDGIAHDITERISMQHQLRQAQKMEAIGQLTGGIAHDFNNILASILGYTGLALEKFAADGEGKLAEYLGQVYSAGERARDLIGQMLAFSRGGAVAPQALNLTPLVKESIKMLRSTIPASIDLSTDLDDDTPAVMMDTVQLHQLVMNLCINARDALETGKGKININLKTISDVQENCSSCHLPITGDFVQLGLKDNGAGIENELLKKVFDPFFTTKEIGKGTGMGLSVVHGIVHEHGGHVVVNSHPGKGTEFRLLFPRLERIKEPITQSGYGTYSSSGNGRIMVVDDDPALSKYLEEMLEDRGYQVTALNDPREALNIFEEDPQCFDLVLTDQTMPKLSGDMLAQAMLVRRPDLPIILCTGYNEQINEERAKELHLSGFFTKPLDPGELTHLMSSLLNAANSTSTH